MMEIKMMNNNEKARVIPMPSKNFEDDYLNTPSLPKNRGLDYNGGDDGGGGNMDDHVTHRELDNAVESLQKDIKLAQTETAKQIIGLSGKIDTIQANLIGKIDNGNSDLSGKINALATSIGSLSKITWWIMGVISASIVIPLIGFLIKVIFKL
ncbi:hypothetical protein HMPREF0496_1072 [Lentilactobacillus hilgardii ATCC 27305]|nr:hypothetical protein HMPREF0496_1072 [Lentilactobacillus hilgardii ATCC 27305]